jgi:hypothetical protein
MGFVQVVQVLYMKEKDLVVLGLLVNPTLEYPRGSKGDIYRARVLIQDLLDVSVYVSFLY